MDLNHLPVIDPQQIGENVPHRQGTIAPKIAKYFLKWTGWTIVGEIPNIKKAVLLAVPHTSNIDGLFAIPALLYLNVDIKLMGKKELFKVPILASILRWGGVISIDRQNKGSTLQANIDHFKQEERLFLGLAPEGTRGYTEKWKTGFYYLALGVEVPILPVAMDYKTKQIRFMPLFYPTGNIEQDLPEIYAYYKGVQGRHVQNMSQPLQDLQS